MDGRSQIDDDDLWQHVAVHQERGKFVHARSRRGPHSHKHVRLTRTEEDEDGLDGLDEGGQERSEPTFLFRRAAGEEKCGPKERPFSLIFDNLSDFSLLSAGSCGLCS